MTRRWSEMRNSTLTIAVIAGIVGLLSLLVIVAPEADASYSGVTPPALGDWVINQDTTVLQENPTIVGNIIVQPGYSLYLRNSGVTIDSPTFAGQYGLSVEADGSIELSQTTFEAKDASKGWTCSIWGDAYLHDNVRLLNVHDGVKIYGGDVTITSTEIRAYGSYGVLIDGADPVLTDVDIYNENDYAVTWSGTYRSLSTVYGIRIYGSSIQMASPTLDDVMVHVRLTDTWSQSVYSSVTENMRVYGMYAYYADLGMPKDLNISMDVKVNASITFSYSYASFYSDMYVYGIYLGGGTKFTGFDNVLVSNSSYMVEVDQTGASSARMYNGFYFYGLYNSVSSTGSVPGTLSSLTIRGHQQEFDDNNSFASDYNYLYGEGIHWYPSSSAAPSGDFIIDNVTLDGIGILYGVRFSDYWDLTISNSNIVNNQIGDSTYHYPYPGFIYARYWSNDITLQSNLFENNVADLYNNYFFDMYYATGDFYLLDNVISENKFYDFYYHPHSSSYEAFDVNIEDNILFNNTFRGRLLSIDNADEINFLRNDLTGNRFNTHTMILNYLRGHTTFRDNTIINNQGTNYWCQPAYLGPEAKFEFYHNIVENNTFQYFWMNFYNIGPINFFDNEFTGNVFSSYFFYVYYPYGGDFKITGNEFFSNRFSSEGFYFNYIGQYSSSDKTDLQMYDNNFINNSGSTAPGDGIIKFYDPRQDFSSSGNYFEENSANCIALEYTNGYYASQYTFTVEGNEFVNNSGKAISFDRLDNINIIITRNVARGNGDYCVYMDFTYNYVDGPDSVYVTKNNFSNNPGGGIYLITGHWIYSYYGNPDQVVSVKRNILVNNGYKGWSLALIGLYKKPSLLANDMAGSAMGLYMERNYEDYRSQEFRMSFIEEVMDGGDEGVTAYGFAYIDADFKRCSMLNFTEALYAKDCVVTAWYSKVPEASGKTEGTGRIYIWNLLEFAVTWANATGVDSGFVVPHATLAMMGANGEYYGGLETDEFGKLDVGLINPWICEYGEMSSWSPFDVNLLASGISTPHKVHVVGDFVEPNPYKLLLIDDEIPQVLISNPQDGTMVNDVDIVTEGFLFEIGSGIVTFEGQTELMGDDQWEDIEPGVIWHTVFSGLDEGEHNLTVRAADLSGNWNMSMISIIIDRTSPSLDVHMEHKDATDIPYNETRKGYFVRENEIVVNGTYSDNFATLEDIVIRVNGQVEDIFLSRLGTIYQEIELIEGFNTIIIDALDVAGNRIVRELFITQDSSPPTIYVYSPRQNEAIGTPSTTVEGLTEPGMKLEIRVESTLGTNVYKETTGEDGKFSVPIELFEGLQKVLVTATDPSSNSNQTFRDVTLDTLAPDFVVNNPPSDMTITKESRIQIICTMLPGGLDAMTYIGGQEVPNEGVFRRWIVLQEGLNVIEILAIDPVGNERLRVVNIIRDTVKPELDVTVPMDTYLLTSTPNVHFEGTVSGADPSGGVVIVHKSIEFPAILLNGGWEETATWGYDLELGPDDLEQYIDVKAFDRAGNEIIVIFHVVYDEIPPALRLDDIPQATENSVITINGSTDVGIMTVYLEGSPFPVIDGEFGIAWPLTEGNNTLTVEVHDAAANSASKTVSIEYTPPEVTVGNGPGGGTEDNFSQLMAWILILAAITLIATAIVVSRSRTSGRR
jgi:hypothetical protein